MKLEELGWILKLLLSWHLSCGLFHLMPHRHLFFTILGHCY